MSAECSKSEPAVAVLAEACAGSADNLCFVQELVEECPAVHSVGAFEPDVRAVLAACILDSKLVERFAHNLCVLHIVSYCSSRLLVAFLCEYSLCGTLNRIGNAVELATLSSAP